MPTVPLDFSAGLLSWSPASNATRRKAALFSPLLEESEPNPLILLGYD